MFPKVINKVPNVNTWRLARQFLSISGAYTMDGTVLQILASSSGGNMIITTPAPNQNTAGIIYTVKKTSTDVNNITLTPASGNIDGAANYKFATAYTSIDFYNDGQNTWII
jgi:hypothetical protein